MLKVKASIDALQNLLSKYVKLNNLPRLRRDSKVRSSIVAETVYLVFARRFLLQGFVDFGVFEQMVDSIRQCSTTHFNSTYDILLWNSELCIIKQFNAENSAMKW
jgi:hypothetical protein